MKSTPSITDLIASCATGGDVIQRRVAKTFEKIERTQPQLNAFLALNEDAARAHATRLDQDSDTSLPLRGVPFSVKDQIITQGLETTCGSNILKGFIPPYQSTVVQRLEDAGAVLVGKTNQDEFGMGSASETSFAGPVRNPWAIDRVAGGSSGGSAASVAAGVVSFSLGTDTGGSIRQPASFTGVVGLKPTYGRVSRYGAIAYASSLDQIGPISRTVEDNARVLQVIEGHDPMDATSAKMDVPSYIDALEHGVAGKRIGLPTEYFEKGLDEGVAEAVRQGVKRLEDAGAIVVDVQLPHTQYVIPTYYILATAEASSNLARFDGVRYGLREKGAGSLDEMYRETRTQGFGSEVRRRILLGTFALSSGYIDAFYLKAQKVRTLVIQDFEKVFEKVDLIAGPTVPTVAWRAGQMSDDPLAMYQTDILTTACNLAGLPGISIPCGFSQELPVGLQLIAPPFQETGLYAAARQHEMRWESEKPGPSIFEGGC